MFYLYHLDTDSSLISALFPKSGRIVLKNCRLLQKTFRPGVTSGFSRACMCEPPPTCTSGKQDSYACRFCFGESASEMEQVRHPPMLEGCSWPFFRMQRRSDCSLLGKPPRIQLLLLRNHWLSYVPSSTPGPAALFLQKQTFVLRYNHSCSLIPMGGAKTRGKM